MEDMKTCAHIGEAKNAIGPPWQRPMSQIDGGRDHSGCRIRRRTRRGGESRRSAPAPPRRRPTMRVRV